MKCGDYFDGCKVLYLPRTVKGNNSLTKTISSLLSDALSPLTPRSGRKGDKAFFDGV